MVFTIYERGGHLGHVTWILRSNLKCRYPRRLHIKFQLDRPSGLKEKKKIFEIVDDDGQTTDSRAPNSAVHGQISWNSELNRDLMVVLVTWKNEEDPIKNNKVNAWTPFSHYKSMGIFSNAQGQITPRPVVGSG